MPSPSTSPSLSADPRLERAIAALGAGNLEAAFAHPENVFVYGTTGGAFVGGTINKWRAAIEAWRQTRNVELRAGGREGPLENEVLRQLNFYDPGPRTRAAFGRQMMDLYYGQGGTNMHLWRVPIIGEYVHRAMEFKGQYDHTKSGRETYLDSFSTTTAEGKIIEGWMNFPRPLDGKSEFDGFLYPDPDKPGRGLTATKEMSRIIREGVKRFGGTLIFEGTNVSYESVFVEGAYVSDTSLEAETLFYYFKPGESRAKFGNGKIIFHWNGQETIPTQALFHSNWFFAVGPSGRPIFHKQKNHRFQVGRDVQAVKSIYNNFKKIDTCVIAVPASVGESAPPGGGWDAQHKLSAIPDPGDRIKTAIRQLGVSNLRAAFASPKNVFVYGTTGGGFVGGTVTKWRSAIEAVRRGRNVELRTTGREGPLENEVLRQLNFYDPGPRTRAAFGRQMMDLYYGQGGTNMHLWRVPIIGEYVHRAMEFKGQYDHTKSGRETYLDSFSTTAEDGKIIEGWMNWPRPRDGKPEFDGFLYPDPDRPGRGLTATKEMSRVIREGVKYFGGTLIFEGTNVSYESVFVEGAYVSDTSLEAETLFAYFRPGETEAKFGNGTIVFHWRGVPTKPTHALFHSNWYFAMGMAGRPIFHKETNHRFQPGKPRQPVKSIYQNFSPV